MKAVAEGRTEGVPDSRPFTTGCACTSTAPKSMNASPATRPCTPPHTANRPLAVTLFSPVPL